MQTTFKRVRASPGMRPGLEQGLRGVWTFPPAVLRGKERTRRGWGLGTQVYTARQDLRFGQEARPFVPRVAHQGHLLDQPAGGWLRWGGRWPLCPRPCGMKVCVLPATNLLPPVVPKTLGLGQKLQPSRTG